jgi:uncharacterized protein YfiM (DUF2279 family)
MMKFLLIALVFLAEAQAQERIRIDDKLHFLASAAVTSTTYAVVYNNTHNKKKALLWGLGTGITVGILKEVYDSTQSHNKFDLKDLRADVLGSLTAAVIIKLF